MLNMKSLSKSLAIIVILSVLASSICIFNTASGTTTIEYAPSHPQTINISQLGNFSQTSTVPLLAPGSEPYDDGGVRGFYGMIKYNGTYYGTYTGNDGVGAGSVWHICLANSTDMIHWNKMGVILEPSGSGWDAAGLDVANLIYKDGIFYLFYQGSPTTVNGVVAMPYQTGLATATSITGPYTRYAGNPIVSMGSAGQWDDASSYGSSITQLNSTTWMLFYTGFRSGLPNGMQIGVMYSNDLYHWTKYANNPISVSGGLTGVEGPLVFNIGNHYYFDLGYQESVNGYVFTDREVLYTNTTNDLLHWEYYDSNIAPGAQNWCLNQIGNGISYVEGNTVYLTYAGSNEKPGTPTEYYYQKIGIMKATFDTFSFTVTPLDVDGEEPEYIIPIQILNAENATATANMPQKVQICSNFMAANLSANLKNINFQDGNGNMLYSWLESGETNTSQSTVYYVKLPSAIPANSSAYIYEMIYDPLVNCMDGVYTGAEPNYTTTYGQYDNGASIFSLYDNFAGSSLNSGIWDIYSAGGTLIVGNGMTLWGGGSWEVIQSKTNFNPQTTVFDVYGHYTALTGGATPAQGIGYNIQNIPQYYVGDQNIGGSTQNTLFNLKSGPTYSGVTIIPGLTGGHNIISVWCNSTSSYASMNYYSYTPNTANYQASTSLPVDIGSGTSASHVIVQWARVRIAPPANIMPTAFAMMPSSTQDYNVGTPFSISVIGGVDSVSVVDNTNPDYTTTLTIFPATVSIDAGDSLTITTVASSGYTFTKYTLSIQGDILGNPVTIVPAANETLTITTTATQSTPSYIPTPYPYDTGKTQTLTYYLNSETQTVNGITAYELANDYGTDHSSATISATGTPSIKIGFRAYLVVNPNVYTEITSGVQEIGTVPSGNYSDYVTGSWHCSDISVILNYQALRVTLYVSTNGGSSYSALTSFISQPLMTNKLRDQTWVFSTYVSQTVNVNTDFSVMFGDSAHNSKISSIAMEIPHSNQMSTSYILSGNWIQGLMSVFTNSFGGGLLGQGIFYGLMLFFFGSTLYWRHRSIMPIVIMCAIGIPSGIGIFALVPGWVAYPLAAIAIAAIGFLIYRLWGR